MTTWVGIDVSRLNLDIGWLEDGKRVHKRVLNSQKGFGGDVGGGSGRRSLRDGSDRYLLLQSSAVPAPGRAFCRCGEPTPDQEQHERDVWELRQLLTLDDKLQHQVVEMTNMAEAFSAMSWYSPEALLRMRDLIHDLKGMRERTRLDMERIAERLYPREVEILATIPGVGKASAIRVAAAMGDFHRFETSRQAVSYVGLSPTLKQSGTSVRSKGHISRMGGARVRGALYMCAMNALRRNAQCKSMWNRMKAKGKHGKVIIVAIMSKLIRQMWALVTSNQVYNPNFA